MSSKKRQLTERKAEDVYMYSPGSRLWLHDKTFIVAKLETLYCDRRGVIMCPKITHDAGVVLEKAKARWKNHNTYPALMVIHPTGISRYFLRTYSAAFNLCLIKEKTKRGRKQV